MGWGNNCPQNGCSAGRFAMATRGLGCRRAAVFVSGRMIAYWWVSILVALVGAGAKWVGGGCNGLHAARERRTGRVRAPKKGLVSLQFPLNTNQHMAPPEGGPLTLPRQIQTPEGSLQALRETLCFGWPFRKPNIQTSNFYLLSSSGQGSLKDAFCNHLKHSFFNTKIITPA